jgi:hypothetical protein
MGEVCVGGGDYASLIVIAPHFPKTLVNKPTLSRSSRQREGGKFLWHV